VTARDETQEIGSGIHERALVDLRRLTERLDAKRNQKTGHPQGSDGA
jgi:predicted thioesterase